jgi:hypothetical protein
MVSFLTENLTPLPPFPTREGGKLSLSPCREQRFAEVPSVVATAEREVLYEKTLRVHGERFFHFRRCLIGISPKKFESPKGDEKGRVKGKREKV